MAADPEDVRLASELTRYVTSALRHAYMSAQTHQALLHEHVTSGALLATAGAEAAANHGGVWENEDGALYPFTPGLAVALARHRQAGERYQAFVEEAEMPSDEDITSKLTQELDGHEIEITLRPGSTVYYGAADLPRTYAMEGMASIRGPFFSWNGQGWFYVGGAGRYYAVRLFDKFVPGRQVEWLVTRLVVR